MLPRLCKVCGLLFIGLGLADGCQLYQSVLAMRRWEQSFFGGSGDTRMVLHDTHVTQFGLPWWCIPVVLMVLGVGCGWRGFALARKGRSA